MTLRTTITDTANSTPYDDSVTGLGEDVQEAIDTLDSRVTGKPRAIIIFGYNGNAGNKWLELHHSIPSNTSPYVAPEACRIKAISIATKSSTTVTASVYINGSVVQTLSISSSQSGSVKDLTDLVNINDEISVKITSGSANEPAVTISLEIQL